MTDERKMQKNNIKWILEEFFLKKKQCEETSDVSLGCTFVQSDLLAEL